MPVDQNGLGFARPPDLGLILGVGGNWGGAPFNPPPPQKKKKGPPRRRGVQK